MRFSAMAFPSLKNVVWLKESKVTLALPLVAALFRQLQGQKWRSEPSRGSETSLQKLLSFALTPPISTKSNPPTSTAVIILSAGLPDFA